MDGEVLGRAADALETCDLFMTIGTSSIVYPAAGFAAQVNPELNQAAPVPANHSRAAVNGIDVAIVLDSTP